LQQQPVLQEIGVAPPIVGVDVDDLGFIIFFIYFFSFFNSFLGEDFFDDFFVESARPACFLASDSLLLACCIALLILGAVFF
jgi:hypothetical protein